MKISIEPALDVACEYTGSDREPADLRYAQIILSADTYRFDASDMMPEAVGSGSFFRGIGDWVEGKDLETVLQEIDDSWPE